MSLPLSRDLTAIDGVSQLPAATLNAIQDLIAQFDRVSKVVCDGSDGSVTLDGAIAAPPWATKSGSVYTLTRDTALFNLTVTGAGTILKTANFRLILNGVLTTAAGGIVIDDGGAANSGTQGLAVAAGSVGTGSNGGNGVNNGVGNPGSNLSKAVGGTGGTGGTGTNAGGAGGTPTAPVVSDGSYRLFSTKTMGWMFSNAGVWAAINGGTGGGGGGCGSGTGNSGGGGAGGGVMVIIAGQIVLANATDLRCAGGAGGNAGAGSAVAGGGAGGAGGVLIVATGYINQTLTAAANCPGGAGGTPLNGGAAGAAGGVGTLIQFLLV